MKRRIVGTFLAVMMVTSLAVGCGSEKADNGEASVATETLEQGEKITSEPTYKTVTEGMDWGPAITKVILNLGVTVDENSLNNDTFTVSSERKYMGFDWETQEPKEADDIVEREITNVYVSDEEGKQDNAGTYVTIEMKVGPDNVEGSPYNYDMLTEKNVLVETSYLISQTDGTSLKTVDGDEVVLSAMGAAENNGNINVTADEFDLSGTYTTEDGEITLTYASYVPDSATEAGSTPLIIWLHGAGEGGTNPIIAIMGNKVVNLATDEVQQYFGETGAEILAPQTPTMWLDDGTETYLDPTGSAYKSCYTEALMGLIENYVAEHPEIDANRIYIGGCSNGGYMTVNMIIEYPEYFAAAYPVCEAYAASWLTDEKVEAIKDIPIWFTAAKTDGVVPIFEGELGEDFVSYQLNLDDSGETIAIDDYTNALYNQLINAGAENVHYSLFEKVEDTSGAYFKEDGVTPYEYMGHWSWIYTLNNECVEEIDGVETTIFDWMSQQSRA